MHLVFEWLPTKMHYFLPKMPWKFAESLVIARFEKL